MSSDSSLHLDAVAHMQQAFIKLKTTTLKQRVQILSSLRGHILTQKQSIVESLMQQCGKTLTDANIEFLGALDWLKWLEKYAQKYLQDEKRPTPLLLMGKRSKIFHEPLGVVLIIAPWNYPFHIGITQIFTAFVCGNAVIYKPSEITPMKGVYESLFAPFAMLKESIKVVYGNGEVGQALIDQKPNKIFFTGSTKTGRAISIQAAQYLIPVDLELGGKDAMIVFAGTNLKRAVAAAIWGAFTHSGQSCSAVERLYVQAPIYEEFCTLLQQEMQKLVQNPEDKQGNADLGRMTVEFQYDIAQAHLDDAQKNGVPLIESGLKSDKSKLIFAPVALKNPPQDSLCVQQESFAPLLPVLAFEDEAQVIKLANDSLYGLQASVFSDDIKQAERVASALEVGGVSINNVNMVEGNPWLSFGGRKQTGHGRARGLEGLYAFTQSKHILMESNSNKIEANWYPYTQKKQALFEKLIQANFTRGIISFIKFVIAGLQLESQSQKPRDD